MSDAEKQAFSQDYSEEAKTALQHTLNELAKVVANANPFTDALSSSIAKLQIEGVKVGFQGSFDTGTNYVQNDGLAYVHQGEAIIPKKYNQPYQPVMSNDEKAYMQQMMSTMNSLDNTMKQGINVSGQFTQRGSDLVAVVNKTNSQTGADLLSNVAYAR